MIAAPRCWTVLDELALQPRLVADDLGRRSAADAGVVDVGELRARVVAPYRQVANLRDGTPALRASWVRPRFSSSMVMANQRSSGMSGALAAAIRQFVLHGLPTTSTRTSVAALRAMARPWPVKMPPLMLSRSLRSMPALRGTAPTRSAQFTPANASLASAVRTMSLSSGKAQSSSSMATPSSAGSAASSSSSCRSTCVSGPNICARRDAEEERVADLAGGAGDGDLERANRASVRVYAAEPDLAVLGLARQGHGVETQTDPHGSQASMQGNHRMEPMSSMGRTSQARPTPARRSRRSPTTGSCPTARPPRWSRRAATSSGCACRGIDSPSVFGAILDRDAGGFRLGPADVQVPAARRYLPGHDGARDELGHAAPAGSSSATCC